MYRHRDVQDNDKARASPTPTSSSQDPRAATRTPNFMSATSSSSRATASRTGKPLPLLPATTLTRTNAIYRKDSSRYYPPITTANRNVDAGPSRAPPQSMTPDPYTVRPLRVIKAATKMGTMTIPRKPVPSSNNNNNQNKPPPATIPPPRSTSRNGKSRAVVNPSPPPPPPQPIRHHDAHNNTTDPVDLPTAYYQAIIQNPAFPHYIDYPARIFHLKYHNPQAAAAASSTSSSSSSWESLHLHQPVSQPRIHASWIRPITPHDRARMTTHFTRFFSTSSFGFRPYRDILYLDQAYLTAAAAAAKNLALPLPTHNIPLLAIDYTILHGDDSDTTWPSLLSVIKTAFPALQRLLLVLPSVVDRPPSDAFAQDAQFGRWMRSRDAGLPELVPNTKEWEWRQGPDGMMTTVALEEVVLLYYRDAFERAVRKGWKPARLFPMEGMNVAMD